MQLVGFKPLAVFELSFFRCQTHVWRSRVLSKEIDLHTAHTARIAKQWMRVKEWLVRHSLFTIHS